MALRYELDQVQVIYSVLDYIFYVPSLFCCVRINGTIWCRPASQLWGIPVKTRRLPFKVTILASVQLYGVPTICRKSVVASIKAAQHRSPMHKGVLGVFNSIFGLLMEFLPWNIFGQEVPGHSCNGRCPSQGSDAILPFYFYRWTHIYGAGELCGR